MRPVGLIKDRDRYMAIVNVLLDRGVDVNAQASDGTTALHQAVYLRDTELPQMLLDRGAHVDGRDTSGRTALLKVIPTRTVGNEHPEITDAVIERDWTMIELLLDNGADINTRDEAGQTLFDQAVESNLETIVKRLQLRGWVMIEDEGQGEACIVSTK